MKKLTKGFSDVPNEVYHADTEYVSSSVLKTILKDIGDYKTQYIDGEKKSFGNLEALNFGSYLHALILEPHLVDVEFQVFDGLQKEGPEWDDFVENKLDPTKILIMGSQQTIAKKLLENYYAKTIHQEDGSEILINSMFVGGLAEESLCTELDGIKVKVRFDYRKDCPVFGNHINDVKTTSSRISTHKGVEKVCKTWGYDVSAALYCDAVEKETGVKHDFYFTFLSKSDMGVTIWKASESMLSRGRAKYKKALAKLKRARKLDLWVEVGIEEIN
jgi:hypothetical protein